MKLTKTAYIAIIFLGCLVLGLSLAGPVFGSTPAAGNPSPELLDRINELRESPAKVLASLGYGQAMLEKRFPGIEALLESGLPAFRESVNLSLVAEDSAGRFFDRFNGRDEGGEVQPLEERFLESGYLFRLGDEAESIVAFNNYMSREAAVEILFRDLVAREMEPAEDKNWKLLSRDLEEAGAFLGSGTLAIGGRTANVYIAAIAFGSAVTPEEEMFFVRLNQARQMPEETALSLGIDPAGEDEGFPQGGYAPLSFNSLLARSSREHGADMLLKGYFSTVSPEGRTVEDRIAGAGYEFETAAETLAVQFHHDQAYTAAEEAEALFRKAFRNDWEAGLRGDAGAVLNPLVKDIGFAFNTDYSEAFGQLCPFCGGDVTLLVADGAARTEPSGPFLMVVLYEDGDGDGLYTAGEGLGGRSVIVENPSGVERTLETGPSGLATLPAGEAGLWRVILSGQEWEIEVAEKSAMLFAVVDGETETPAGGEEERNP